MEPYIKKAPAKLNLYLHITGKRADGYHMLDSLVAFTNLGDEILITAAPEFDLSMTGPFGAGLNKTDNLVVKAARAFSNYTGHPLNLHITLIKNIPVAAGLGGGSADAAATLCALNDFWDTRISVSELATLALPLGADVPMCLSSTPAYISGIGEVIEPTSLPSLPLLLVNPNRPCSTAQVFSRLTVSYGDELTTKPSFKNSHDLIDFLKEQENQLTAPAIQIAPEISEILDFLDTQPGCTLSRMSGSGATCFGLFTDKKAAQNAHTILMQRHPHYWSCATEISA